MANDDGNTSSEGRRNRRARGQKVKPANPSLETVLDQWRKARPKLDLGPLGLFAALAQADWLTAPGSNG
jgi:hypothetical protein